VRSRIFSNGTGSLLRYRIFRELELNLRFKPRKRLVSDKAGVLTVPQGINQVWSMDVMHDQQADG